MKKAATKKAVRKKLATKRRKGMSPKEYLAALDQLGLTIASKSTAEKLGLGVRQCMRMGHGKANVPRPVELLLQMYLKHGIDE